MKNKKLTDSEIKKALECCSKKNCKQCPNFSEDIECSEKLINLTLDLITRQQAELENLKVELQSMRGAANSLKMHYEEAQAQIERLKKTEIEIDDFCRRLCRMRMLNGNAIASYEDLQNYIQQEKSEAVKEFAARLKEKRKKAITCEVVIVDDIDNLAKEMVGDDNA
ncbi:MAG: hypothetical protein UHO61_05115 [Acutalibacteraceae bacterium]|nr:hypothetical protein [Acutalibacteraceae bacterium]